MLDRIIKIVIIMGALSVLISFIPDSVTAPMDNAIIYILSSVNSLYFVFHTDTILYAIQLFMNFQIGVAIFWIFHWLMRLIHA